MTNKKNQGFSLIELVVVIGIMMILMGAGTIAFQNTGSRQVKNATDYVGSYLDYTKNFNLTKSSTYFSVTKTSEGYVVANSQGNEKRLPSDVEISYETNLGDKVIVSESAPLMLSYSRVTGGFTAMIASVNQDGSYTYQTKMRDGSSSAEDVYCKRIILTSKGISRSIQLYEKTGKYKVEE